VYISAEYNGCRYSRPGKNNQSSPLSSIRETEKRITLTRYALHAEVPTHVQDCRRRIYHWQTPKGRSIVAGPSETRCRSEVTRHMATEHGVRAPKAWSVRTGFLKLRPPGDARPSLAAAMGPKLPRRP